MKRIFSIIAILSLIVSIGCQNENTTDPASFALEISEVDASAEGCDVEINYTITNPESGAVVLTSCSENWIKNLSTATQGKIKFSVAANYQKQAREAEEKAAAEAAAKAEAEEKARLDRLANPTTEDLLKEILAELRSK
jgi:ABC-type phosphate/phosphonate transport system substrate-binding protein